MTTATNPKTGEKVAFVNGQWVPFTQSATNKEGNKAYLTKEGWVSEDKEPTLQDKAKSYATSAYKGFASLPEGMFQLGANVGDQVNRGIDALMGRGDLYGDGIELTEGAKETAKAKGIQVPERQPHTYAGHVNKTIRDQYAEKEALKNKAGREGFDWAELAGMMANPVNYVKPGGPLTQKVTDGLLERTLRGVGVGGAYGTAMSTTNPDYWKGKGEQAGTGAIIGGGLPVVGASGRAIGRGIDEFTRPMNFRNAPDSLFNKLTGAMPGIKRDIHDIVNGLLGQNKNKAIAAMSADTGRGLNKTKTSGQKLAEYNVLNPNERVGNPLVKLESELSRHPATTDELNSVYRAQKNSRQKVVDAIAGDSNKMEAAINARSAATNPYYKATEASQGRVESKPVLDVIDSIIGNNKNRSKVVAPLTKYRNKLIQDGKIDTSPKNLKSLSDEIGDDLAAKNPQTGGNEYNVKALTTVKKALDTQIKREVPEYGVGNKIHARKSAPINQMNVARALQKKMGEEVGDEAAKPFMKAMADEAKLVKQSTGYKRGGEDAVRNVFKGNKKAYDDLKAVVDDLEVNLEFNRMANESNGVMNTLKAGIEPRIPNILRHEVTLTNSLLSKIAKDKTGEYAKVVTELIEKPKEFAGFLNLPPNSPIVNKMLAIFKGIGQGGLLTATKEEGR